MSREQTREALLGATIRLVAERGYKGATTREIAREAGVTELTLFRHFGSKEALFKEVLDNCSFREDLMGLLPELEGLTLKSALGKLAMSYMSALRRRKALVSIMISEHQEFPSEIQRLHNDIIDEIIAAMAGFLKAGRGSIRRGISAERAARLFFGTLFAHFLRTEVLMGGEPTDRELRMAVSGIIEIYLYGVAGEGR